ncbi:MAG: efflux RND transporter permease subunit [bacterium]
MSEHHQQQTTDTQPPLWNFNYWITKLFLDNSRLTFLILIFLVVVGVFTGLNLKTTGFPSPVIAVSLVQTVYPGASSDTVNSKLTIPLEGAIKDVLGVKRFNSTSTNSFSNISVYIDEKADVNVVKNKIDSAVRSVKLPDGAQSPKLVSLEIGGPDVIYAIIGPNIQTIHDKFDLTKIRLSQITDVSKATPSNDLEKQIEVRLKQDKLLQNKLTAEQVQSQLATIGESIPVISDITIDGKNAGISTSLKGVNLDTLQNFNVAISSPFTSQTAVPTPPKFVKLSEIADIKTAYNYSNPKEASFYSFYDQKNSKDQVLPAAIIDVKSVKNTDQGKFIEEIKKELTQIDGLEYIRRDDVVKNYDPQKTYIIESFAVNDDNKEQVDQVIGGLIGEKFGDSIFGNVGYLLGGIQLVILVMILFVSWRAALVAATAIPLSLLFSTIYLWLIGENLNTLVLFSLVLVIGLVVDPALVILEAIQRKIDVGLKGKEAVLAAVKDVGNGIFLAVLTSIIVFVPFGILTGVFGQIFAYIPLTIIPALIGSYIVPLVFLAWFGSIILKKSKNTTHDEAENLWPIAKWLMKLNSFLLYGPKIKKAWLQVFVSRLIRFVVIVIGFIVPVTLAGIMFNNGSIKQVQFAQSDDANLILVSGSFLPSISKEDRLATTQESLSIITKNENVRGVVTSGSGFNYYIFLKPRSERNIKAPAIADKIDEQVQARFGSKAELKDQKFFDVKVASAQTGGASSGYQVSITIAENDLDTLKTSSLNVGQTVLDKLCRIDNVVSIKDDCSDSNKIAIKVDDGFTNKDNFVYDVAFDRDKLVASGAGQYGRGPITLPFNGIIKQEFEFNNGDPITKVLVNGEETNVVLKPNEEAPKTVAESAERLAKVTGSSVAQVSQLASVVETKPKVSIQRIRGKTVGLVQARLKPELQNNQGVSGQATQAIVDYYNKDGGAKSKDLGLSKEAVKTYDDGQTADGQKFFTDLSVALLLSIVVTYIVLAVFFRSLSQPFGILYTIPLSMLGVLPALAAFVGGQFGFLEIIGLIILVGIVENVAIFLIDAANQKIDHDGWEEKRAIIYASGLRLKPVLLTKIAALASLAPLAITSQFYRSISVVIMFGILASGALSLVTTTILFIFFKWFSHKFHSTKAYWWPFVIVAFPIYLIVWGIQDLIKENKHDVG